MNERQEIAANFKDGQMLVISCPGSGKTTVIVERCNRLIESGVSPENILVITFTKEAATQMEERFKAKYARTGIFFGTIHSICFKVLGRAYGYTREDILLETEKWEFFYNYLLRAKVKLNDVNEFIKAVVMEISKVKNTEADYRKHTTATIDKDLFRILYVEYEEYKKSRKKIDFDDMLTLSKKVFAEKPEELAYWKKQYQYIMIDEFQDTNGIQADILYLLTGNNGNLFAVGDDDQSIYGFRAADSKIMLNFTNRYTNAQKVYMDINYRSCKKILEYASKLIKCNQIRFEKELKGYKEENGRVECIGCESNEYEISAVVKQLNTYFKSGVSLNEMAVLYRTNMENQLLIGRLMKLGVPFYTTETPRDYHEDFIFRDIMAYWRLSEGMEKKGDFQRILNRPKRYLNSEPFKTVMFSDKVAIDKACKKFGEREVQAKGQIITMERDIKQLKGKTPQQFMYYLEWDMNYIACIEDYCKFMQRDVEEAKQLFKLLKEEAKEFQTMKDWKAYSEFYAEELQKKKRDKRKLGICLSTFHSAKGLEWDKVLILNANEGSCPHKKAETMEDIEEERRLFYVGITRAREDVCIYYTQAEKDEPSRFLFEMGMKKLKGIVPVIR